MSISVVTSPTANMKSLPVGNVVALAVILAQGYLLGASGMHLESYWESHVHNLMRKSNPRHLNPEDIDWNCLGSF